MFGENVLGDSFVCLLSWSFLASKGRLRISPDYANLNG
jgi:hypothetical protein